MATELTLNLPAKLAELLQAQSSLQGRSIHDFVLDTLWQALSHPQRQDADVARQSGEALHLSSPIISLVEGILTGDTTIGDVLQKGDFGLGTLNHLDGEVVVLDGVAYQQGGEGACRVVDPSEKTPFMTVTRWRPDHALTLPLSGCLGHAALLEELQRRLPSPNLLYAIRLAGRFERLRARSVRKQEVDRPLAAVAKEQAVFELGSGSGVLVGFWSPAFLGSALTVPGFHLHYLSDDRRQGGHLLDSVLLEGQAQIQALHHADTDLPRTQAFLQADLSRDPAADLEGAEK